jgi:ubiquinone/menaquinone biosynthesis C-methylase UbiE
MAGKGKWRDGQPSQGELMRIWADSIFPRLLELMMRDNDELKELRTRALAPAQGRILELGIGTGLNLAHYPPSVREIAAVDPSPGMAALAQRRMRESGVKVEHHQIGAESLCFDTGSFDSVVCTLTLCSIPNVPAALAEVWRVLKPGGQFLFLEHGRHADAAVAKWQGRLNPLWGAVFDGCHLNRDIEQLVSAAGLQLDSIDHPHMKSVPRIAGYMYLGRAQRPA